MISRLKTWATPATIQDENLRRRARLLSTILIALMGGNVIYVIILPFLTPNFWTLLLIDLPIFVIYGLFLYWLRKGFVQRVGLALCITLWTYLTILGLFTGGIEGPGVFTLILTVPIAAMLLGGRAALFAAIMIGGSALVQYGVETTMGLPAPIVAVTPIFNVGTVVVIAIVFGLLARLAAWNMQQGLQRALVANQALQESEHRYRTLIENAPDGIVLIDLDTLQLLDANRAAEELFGRPAAELLSMTMEDLMQNDENACTREKIRLRFEEACREGSLVCEQRFRRQSGNTFSGEVRLVYLPAGPIPCIRVSIIDISERKQREKERQREQERLEQIISAIPGSVAITSLEKDGLVLWANEEMAQMVGVPRKQLAGRRIHGFYSSMAERNQILKQIREIGFLHNAEFQVRDGQNRTFRARISAQTLEYRGQQAVLGIVENIEEAKQAEEILQKAQKLESLGLLAGGIAHDFNNLLSAIMGQSSLAMIRLDEDHPARKNVEKSVLAAERAAGLTQQMLAYSGRGQFSIQTVDLNRLVKDNIQLLSASIPKRIRLLIRPAATPLPVEVDTSQIQQVVMNLLLNASQAIGARAGTIAIESKRQDVAADDHHLWRFTGHPLSPGRYANLSVRDDGAGMTREVMERIFDPFFTTKENGSGLGLAAVLGILRGHGGGIDVNSIPGEGTTFSILLPLSSGIMPDGSDARGMVREPASPSSLVLVIDDEPPITEFVRDALEMIGIDTVSAHDGAAGIESLRARAREVGLVILDLSMPGLSSVETYHSLRQINPAVHIALTSGYDRQEATQDFPSDGLIGFIPKPLTAERLQARVREFLTTSPS